MIFFNNIKGWNNYTYDKKALFCIFNRQLNLSYNWYLDIVNVFIPSVSFFFCYWRIFVFTHKSKNTSKSSSVNRSIHLAKTFFVSFLVYNICWMPFGLVVVLDFDNKLPRSIVMYSIASGILNSTLNPIIYVVFNSNFRKSCENLLNKICCFSFLNLRNNRVSASGNHNSIIQTNNPNNLVQIQTRVLYDSKILF